eukprot:c16612_g1_i2.p1 GENE.c16612_g1_i2~~c16612_g1_i2.p1  ORF type:complete len:153 (+),score=28.85 c16612_g1_i2:60-518(+)
MQVQNNSNHVGQSQSSVDVPILPRLLVTKKRTTILNLARKRMYSKKLSNWSSGSAARRLHCPSLTKVIFSPKKKMTSLLSSTVTSIPSSNTNRIDSSQRYIPMTPPCTKISLDHPPNAPRKKMTNSISKYSQYCFDVDTNAAQKLLNFDLLV